MAYEFKKLSDVNVIETMNDSLNVLVENDGEIVKIAANEMMSAVEVPEGFSGSWNDLEDRPFGESVGKAIALPEQSVAFTNKRAYLSGDFSKIYYGHEAVHVVWDDTEYVCKCAWFQEGYAFGNFSAYGGWSNGEPFNAMMNSNSGITIESIDGSSPHTVEIFVYDEVINPINEKFIPDTIARTANTATTWYVDSKISSLPEPFSGSWDDLTDKPFWELSNEMIPKEHHSIPYSEDYFCDAKVYQPIIAGEKYTLSWDTYVYEAICQENGTVSFDMPGFVNINGLVVTSDDSTEKYKLEIIGTGTSYYLSATIGLTGPTPLQTIDEKFIPDTIPRLVTVNVDYDSEKGYEVASMTPLEIYEHYLAGDICQCTHAGSTGKVYNLVEISDTSAVFSGHYLYEEDGETKVYFNTISIDLDGKSKYRYKYL